MPRSRGPTKPRKEINKDYRIRKKNEKEGLVEMVAKFKAEIEQLKEHEKLLRAEIESHKERMFKLKEELYEANLQHLQKEVNYKDEIIRLLSVREDRSQPQPQSQPQNQENDWVSI
ncbi:9410_t:CDS:1, partial [Acaulospora colombiana]